MDTFSELLTKYTQRTGISDAELARSVGVGRQTIFRWKEGLVGRPRHRDDVLKCAQRLRLSTEETDELLIAAGFPPEHMINPIDPASAPDDDISPDLHIDTHIDPHPDTDPTHGPLASAISIDAGAVDQDSSADTEFVPRQQWPTSLFLPIPSVFYTSAAILLLASTIIGVLLWGRANPQPWVRPTALPATLTPPIQATPGENLLLVAQFKNYVPNINYNVSGRLQDALQTQIDLVQLENVRVAQWPDTIESTDQALAILDASDATMLVWGEYDSGRVLVSFTTHDPSGTATGNVIDAEMEQQLPSPDDLSTTINVDVPQQVRGVALLTLGRLYRGRGEWESARVALEETLTLRLPDSTRGTTYFYLGTIYTNSIPPDLERAIDAYTNALALRPNDANALYNRGKAYIERYQLASGEADSHDLTLALGDLSRTIELKPAYAAAYNNRGIIYYVRKQKDDMVKALRDLNRAVALDPETVEYRFNRALGHIRLDNADAWQADLAGVLDQSPAYNSARVALCWGHALDQQPDLALPQCQAALAQEPDRHDVYDSLGIVYAQLGEFERAVEQFEAYLAWLNNQPDNAYALYNGPLIESWIEALKRGNNPIDATTLKALR